MGRFKRLLFLVNWKDQEVGLSIQGITAVANYKEFTGHKKTGHESVRFLMNYKL